MKQSKNLVTFKLPSGFQYTTYTFNNKESFPKFNGSCDLNIDDEEESEYEND